MLDLCLPSQCTFCHRFQGDSQLEQPGCYHHCVDENIERRNHYLDLAGIENYASQFGPGKGPLGGVSTENTVLGSGLCSLRTGEMWNFLLDISEALLRDSCIKDVSKMKVVLGQSWAKPRRMRGLQIQPTQWSHLGHPRSGPALATAPVPLVHDSAALPASVPLDPVSPLLPLCGVLSPFPVHFPLYP